VLSGSHLALAEQILAGLDEHGARERIAVVVGGIVPPADVEALKAMGVRRVFTPSDYELLDIMESIVALLEDAQTPAAVAS
jgi:(2R)-ethylmalonyl-CoA mutase